MWAIVREGGVLDQNSSYAYVLMAERFADTCVVADRRGSVQGFVLGFRPPRQPDVVFVWQIGVHSRARGRGLGRSMLLSLIEGGGCEGVRYLETHITPANIASQRLFRSFARHAGDARVERGGGYHEGLFPEAHEPEDLYRIGPFGHGGARA